MEQAKAKYLLGRTIVVVVGTPFIVGSFWIPLQPIRYMIEALAGKETDLVVRMSFTVALSLTLAGVGWAAIRKFRSQRRQLERLRERITDLEEQLSERKE